MKVFCCDNAFALEEVFRARMRAAVAARSNVIDPITVVAPTARLLARLRVLAAEALGPVCGIDFLVHRTLAERILEYNNIQCLTTGGGALAALASAGAMGGEGPLAQAVARFEGMEPLLASTFCDLRDSGVPRLDPAACGASEILAAWNRYINKKEQLRWKDGADLYQEAAAAAPDVAARFGTIIHAGATDLTGVVSRLLKALDACRGIEMIALGVGPGPAMEWGRRRIVEFLDRVPEGAGGAVGVVAGRSMILFQPDANPGEPSARGAVEFIEAPDARSEVELAVRRIALWHEEGVPLERMAILSRTLDGRADVLEDVLSQWNIEFTSSATASLSRRPEVRAVSDAFRCILGDFEPSEWLRFLKNPAVDCTSLVPSLPGSFSPDLAGASVRKYHIRGARGFIHEWIEFIQSEEVRDDAAAAARDRQLEQARSLAALTAAALALGAPLAAARSFREASDAARNILSHLFPEARAGGGDGGPSWSAIPDVLDELILLDAAGIPFTDARSWLERYHSLLATKTEPVRRPDRGGVRILDFQQCRGLTFERAILIGAHEGALPRAGSEDPLFPDAARASLAARIGVTIPLKLDAGVEERWLFTLAITSIRERICFIWQRSDESGRPRNVSPYVREAARVLHGSAADVQKNKLAIAGHPARGALQKLQLFPIMDHREAALTTGLLAPDPPAAAARWISSIGNEDPVLVAGYQQIGIVESFEASAESGRFDGGVEAGTDEAFAITAFETLVRCPLQYFFRHGLRVRPLEERAEDVVDARRIGMFVHGSLAELLGGGVRPDPEVEEIIQKQFDHHVRPALRRMPVLAGALHRQWSKAIYDVVTFERNRIRAMQAGDIRHEVDLAGTLVRGNEQIVFKGRADRILTKNGGERLLTDYKTRRSSVDDLVRVSKMRTGAHLQMALYALVFEAVSAQPPEIEVLQIHPDADPEESPAAGLDMKKFNESREEIVQLIFNAAALERAGRHPLALNGGACQFCEYTAACRRNHAPTRARHESAKDFQEYYQMTGLD